MKRKRKLFYMVTPWDTESYWWVPKLRKWLTTDKSGEMACSNTKRCRTFDQAMKIANQVPLGTVLIVQFYWKKGHRWSKDYYLKRK